MWIVFGTQTRTELVEGGARAERTCERCGEHATFYERRAMRTFSLYFLPVFDYQKQRVMACGACGTLFATDELGRPDASTRASWEEAMSEAGEKARGALDQAVATVGPAVQSAGKLASDMLGSASQGLGPAMRAAGETLGRFGEQVAENVRRIRVAGSDDEPEREADDAGAGELDPEKAELLRRFAELERRMKEKP